MKSGQRLRRTPTPAEIGLWRLIYPLRTSGHHFRKQAPIGPYVADFVCHAAKLVIEIDGDSHFSDAGIARDQQRDAFLAANGYRVVHFTNADVLTNAEGVFRMIEQALVITPS